MNALVNQSCNTETTTFPDQRQRPVEFLKPTVLFVDDDKFALEELTDIADLEGWNSVTAENIDDALKALKDDKNITTVVTDVHFTGAGSDAANGIQFVSRAKAQFMERKLNYIILSGDPDSLEASIQEEAIGFLPKPLNPADLVLEVETALAAERTPMYWTVFSSTESEGAGQ